MRFFGVRHFIGKLLPLLRNSLLAGAMVTDVSQAAQRALVISLVAKAFQQSATSQPPAFSRQATSQQAAKRTQQSTKKAASKRAAKALE